MASSQARSASLKLARLFREFQDHPELIFRFGLLKLNSSFSVDDEGDIVPNPGGMSMFNTYRPTRIQRRLDDLRRLCRETNHETSGTILKARDVGGTINVAAWDVARVVTMSGAKALTVAHQPGPAQNIFETKRKMEASLPEWMRPLDKPGRIKDSAEARDIEIPHFGIKHSRIACVPATSIDAVRSDRFIHMHFSEASRFEDPKAVREAIGALAVTVPKDSRWMLARWDESTANGEDGFFDIRFKESWESQGERNFWMPGAKLWRYPTTAVFFPFYMETNKKIQDLHPDVSYDDLLADLDEQEKELLNQHILPYWQTMYPGEDKLCLEGALRQINWRRSKVPSAYPNWPSSGAMNTYGSLQEFAVEEPATPEQAFLNRDFEPVFSKAQREGILAGVKPPVAKGLCIDGSFSTSAGNYIWIWKMPEDTSGDLSLGVDFAPGSDEVKADPTALDSTYAVLFDRATGEQVAEYVSQEPDYVAAMHIFDMLIFYKSNKDGAEKPKDSDWPYVAPETRYGQNFMRLIREKGFPPSRIYKHVAPNKTGRQSLTTFGFEPTRVNAQANAISNLLTMISSGERTLRSERLYLQTKFLVRKGTKVEAQNKGKGGISSKDDGLLACAIEAYCECNGSRPSPAVISHTQKGAGPSTKQEPVVDSSNLTDWLQYRRAMMEKEAEDKERGRFKPKKKVFLC